MIIRAKMREDIMMRVMPMRMMIQIENRDVELVTTGLIDTYIHT
jgi:hypothetical protein